MKPISLTMEAFGSYGKKTTIDFTIPNQNLFLITGDTGAGKSTIFDAIVFSIYGEASSGTNKKDGAELQSQFVDFDTTPFVELMFSEKNGESEDVYTVRRIPRHNRHLKRGSGVKEEKETVSLIMSDGREYSQNIKETNGKLVEIVGLSKNQFMQVAMIAQGEFMELLRAKSDDKKLIFRKLFHTSLFQNIVEELGNRKKEKQSIMAQIRTACQTEVSHIILTEEYENWKEIAQLKEKIVASDKFSVTQMEKLSGYLQELCSFLNEKMQLCIAQNEQTGVIRDQARDDYTNAKNLLKFYDQLDAAKETIGNCKALEEEMLKSEKLIGDLRACYQIQAEHNRLEDAVAAIKSTEDTLNCKQAEIPRLQQDYEEKQKEEIELRKTKEKEIAAFSKLSQQVEGILLEVSIAEGLKGQVKNQEEKVKKAQKMYATAKENYQKKNQEYIEKQAIFLDAQAGFLAKEKLRPGEPCPVCGSMEHPAPCQLTEIHDEVTREAIDQLSTETDRFRQVQEEKAAEAKTALEILEEKKKQLKISVDKIQTLFNEKLGETTTIAQNKEYTDVAKVKVILDDIVTEASNRKEKIEAAYEAAKEEALKRKQKVTESQAIIAQCKAVLPTQIDTQNQRKLAYESTMAKYESVGKQWKVLLASHTDVDVEKLQQKINDYKVTKDTALQMKESAQKAIGELPRPQLQNLLEAKEQAESKWQHCQKVLEQVKLQYNANLQAYNSMAPKMEQRSKIMTEFHRIEGLYNLLGGKVSGGRMDIETYVQRYYLERILDGANIRLQDMSAGQFELRMYDIEKAGEGRNRGLDLMVYSTVTGKEREVRTLSGGESFMAALALALGMADQIQEASAAINLDMMFIDEGFGSLDEQSRNQAVKVLKQMAGGTKLVGLISHVSELKQEIDNQLIVKKDEKGSYAQWQIS